MKTGQCQGQNEDWSVPGTVSGLVSTRDSMRTGQCQGQYEDWSLLETV